MPVPVPVVGRSLRSPRSPALTGRLGRCRWRCRCGRSVSRCCRSEQRGGGVGRGGAGLSGAGLSGRGLVGQGGGRSEEPPRPTGTVSGWWLARASVGGTHAPSRGEASPVTPPIPLERVLSPSRDPQPPPQERATSGDTHECPSPQWVSLSPPGNPRASRPPRGVVRGSRIPCTGRGLEQGDPSWGFAWSRGVCTGRSPESCHQDLTGGGGGGRVAGAGLFGADPLGCCTVDCAWGVGGVTRGNQSRTRDLACAWSPSSPPAPR